MDTIKDLLARRKQSEPPEIQIIKDYVQEHFKSDVTVTVQEKTIIIGVSGSGLAGSLRPQLHQLSELCGTTKRLVIRIGA